MNRASFAWRRFLFAALVCGWAVLVHSQSRKLWQVYAEAGETAFQEDRRSSAEVMLLSAIKEAESEGVQDPWLGKINYELGRLYSTTGYKNHGKAEGHFLAALHMWEQSHEPDTDEIANCLNDLGRSLDSPARQKGAERPYSRAIGIFEKLNESSNVAVVVNNLASTYCAQDKFAEAEKSVKEGLEFIEQSKKADDKTVASLVDTLVAIHLLQNRIEEAEAAYRRLQSLGEAGKDYANRLGGAWSRAKFLYEAKRYPEAERLLKSELALLKKQSALTTLAAANAFDRLADVHYRQQHFKEAETDKEQSIEIAKKVLGPDIPTDGAQAELAVIQYAQGNARAESLFQESLGSMKKRRAEMKSPEDQQILGKQIADCLELLAELYGGEGKNEQSASLYKEALDVREKDIGQDDPGTIATTNAYIGVLRKLKRDAEAHELEARLRQISK
jgi:tetratricopeptide (TPR) repeat protein